MTEKLTICNLTRERLEKLVPILRQIVARADNEAADMLDELLADLATELRPDADTALDDASDDVDDDSLDIVEYDLPVDASTLNRETAEDLLSSLRELIRGGSRLSNEAFSVPQYVAEIRRYAEDTQKRLDPDVKTEFESQLAAARSAALTIAWRAEATFHTAVIKEAAMRKLHSSASAQSLIRQVNEALEVLSGTEHLTPEVQVIAREAKTRAAMYRARRKREDAEIAEAGGNTKKAERWRAEARALFLQDCRLAFRDDEVPDYDSQS